MENEVIRLVKAELSGVDIVVAIKNICDKKELVALMVGYILADESIIIENE